ncbi:MAG: hypothetical protein PHW93_05635 [Candidatus Methanomethylophilaceae archaeon]|jgi:hypothetical protein|nr:hypothetical protein [Candidatus Methanomethylophilaceae archaeon]
MLRPLLANNKFPLDLSGKILVLFTDDQTKLPKYNQWTEDGAHIGYTNTTLSLSSLSSLDDDTGLFWMARPILAVLDPDTNYIDYLIFSHPIKSISLTAEDGGLTRAVVEIAYGTVQVGQMFFASIDTDDDADGRPDCLDPGVKGSLPWLLKGHGFSFEGGQAPSVEYAKVQTSDGYYVLTSDGAQVLVRL